MTSAHSSRKHPLIFFRRARVESDSRNAYMWLSTKFKAPAAHHTLQEFREVYAEFGAECGDPHVRIINGSELIDHDPALYEPDHVHPRDAGIEQLAERLAEQLMEDL